MVLGRAGAAGQLDRGGGREASGNSERRDLRADALARTPSRWGYLGNAFVPASYRGQGIGERLVAALLEYADAEGLVRVVLSPSARSVSLYERLGFGAAHMLMSRVRRAEDQSVH